MEKLEIILIAVLANLLLVNSAFVSDRIDCYLDAESPLEQLTRDKCEHRNCVYDADIYQSPRVPKCYFDRKNLGYKLTKTNNFKHFLQQKGRVPFPGVVRNLELDVEYLGRSIIHVKIRAVNKTRYEVPIELNKPSPLVDHGKSNAKFDYYIDSKTGLFWWRIVRRGNQEKIFDSSFGAFVYSEQFLQISTILPTENIYGFGENNHVKFKHDLNYTSWAMFNRDNAPGFGKNKNTYGFHPFYMGIENTGKSHGVLLLNSNAMEYLFTPYPSLTLRTIGGVLDFYFFVDETPEDVLKSYHQLIGPTMFPPYWSLGFQLSRYGYTNLEHIQIVINRTREAQIPQDVQYADIDYMIGYKIFTVDPVNYKGIYKYFKHLQETGLRVMLILDPALVIERRYTPFVTGYENDVFIRWPDNLAPVDEDLYSDYVWPDKKVVYPDFFLNRTRIWWGEMIKEFRTNEEQGSPFDGLWIDMNEPSSFDTNEARPCDMQYRMNISECVPVYTLKCPINRLDDPPYRTKAAFRYDAADGFESKARLSQKTICMITMHGEKENRYYHYDVHNLYGYAQAIATNQALRNTDQGKRPFVLTRSTFVGSGQYAAHWTGDNDSSWKHLRMSIIALFEFNMFGIPMVGADICGFFGEPSLELCIRWHQLGAFYPFSRNHNTNFTMDQDPVAFNNACMIKSTSLAFNIRYTILPYLYTLFYKSHTSGGSVFTPLAFRYSNDSNTWDIQEQFLLGPAFLVSPVVHKDQRSITAYFPRARWYDFRTGELQAPGFHHLHAPLDYINIHVCGGHILPLQNPREALNTFDSRRKPFQLIVALDEQQYSKGELFWDNGESDLNLNKYYHAKFVFNNNTLSMNILANYMYIENKRIDEISIYGFENEISQVLIEDQQNLDFIKKRSNVVILKNTNIKINKQFSISFKK